MNDVSLVFRVKQMNAYITLKNNSQINAKDITY